MVPSGGRRFKVTQFLNFRRSTKLRVSDTSAGRSANASVFSKTAPSFPFPSKSRLAPGHILDCEIPSPGPCVDENNCPRRSSGDQAGREYHPPWPGRNRPNCGYALPTGRGSWSFKHRGDSLPISKRARLHMLSGPRARSAKWFHLALQLV